MNGTKQYAGGAALLNALGAIWTSACQPKTSADTSDETGTSTSTPVGASTAAAAESTNSPTSSSISSSTSTTPSSSTSPTSTDGPGSSTTAGEITDTSSTTSATTGTSGGLCELEGWPEDSIDPCEQNLSEGSCLASRCTWIFAPAQLTIDSCQCIDHGSLHACVKTPNGRWGGATAPSAIFRVSEGAVEVLELDFIPFDVPAGWHLCKTNGSPATCMCACGGHGCALE